MKDIVLVIATVCLYFGGSVLFAYCLFWYFASRQANPGLKQNSSVKLVGPGGTYRCHFLRNDDEFLVFSNPLQADRYVPIRVGEKLLVSATSANGLIAFRSEVVERDPQAHELRLKRPNFVKRTDRRATQRWAKLLGEDVLIDGEPGEIVDHSSMGMCVLTGNRPSPGAVVHISLPAYGINAHGWAVEAVPSAYGRRGGFKIHIQFQEEQTFEAISLRKRAFVK